MKKMTAGEIQYNVEQAKEALDKCFEYLGEDTPNFIEADYWLANALAELNEARKPLSALADEEEKELEEREMAKGYEVIL